MKTIWETVMISTTKVMYTKRLLYTIWLPSKGIWCLDGTELRRYPIHLWHFRLLPVEGVTEGSAGKGCRSGCRWFVLLRSHCSLIDS
ncbi:hypothetical protein T09_13739 [Trichinella sp. T9]|nr:hypothetical protein T09_13739 [Trichinella sp. T9]